MKLFLIYILQKRKLFILSIYYVYPIMRRIKTQVSNEIHVTNIQAYFEKTVTSFGNGAKVDTPKEYLRKRVIVLVLRD